MNTYIFSLYAVLRGVGNLTSGRSAPHLPTLVACPFSPAILHTANTLTPGPISTKLLKTGVFRGAAGAYGSTNFGAVLIYTAATITGGGILGIFFPN